MSRTRHREKYHDLDSVLTHDLFFQPNVDLWTNEQTLLPEFTHASSAGMTGSKALAERQWLRDVSDGDRVIMNPCRDIKETLSFHFITAPDDSSQMYWDNPVISAGSVGCRLSRTGLRNEFLFREGSSEAWGAGISLIDRSPAWNSPPQVCWSKFLRSLDGDLSLVNFLLELKDILTLASSFKRAARSLHELAEAGPKGASITTLLSLISDGVLSVYFGIKPLLMDLGHLVQRMVRWRDIAAEYFEEAKRIQKVHVQQNVPAGFLSTIRTAQAERGGVPVTLRQYLSGEFSDYVATLHYKYRVEGAELAYREIRSLLRILGVKADMSIVWNAIPYSFVVDWVTNVNQVLESHSRETLKDLDAVIELSDYCHSVKGGVVEELFVSGHVADDEGNTSEISECLARRAVSLYQRDRFIPHRMKTDIQFRKPGAMQIVLGAALIGSRIGYKKRFLDDFDNVKGGDLNWNFGNYANPVKYAFL